MALASLSHFLFDTKCDGFTEQCYSWAKASYDVLSADINYIQYVIAVSAYDSIHFNTPRYYNVSLSYSRLTVLNYLIM